MRALRPCFLVPLSLPAPIPRHSTLRRFIHHLTMVQEISPAAPPSPIAVIGAAGNMGTALITGLLTHANPPSIHGASPRWSSMDHLPLPESHKHTDNAAASDSAELILLCVKPRIIPAVLGQLAPSLRRTNTPVLSVAAGVTTSAMEEVLISEIGTATPVLRAMPNTPAAQAAGVTALCKGSTATDEHMEMARATLSAVGDVVEVPESLFAAATGVAGCGVAYVFMMAEALADAGVQCGLPRDVAIRMAAGTVYGAGATLRAAQKEDVHPAVLRNRVESPGGVTIRATAQLERAGFRADVIDAVIAAFERTREMGEK